jgi:hypothetical protein
MRVPMHRDLFAPRPLVRARGPSSRRGRQFSQTSLPELLDALGNARTRLHLIETLDKPMPDESAESSQLRAMSAPDLAALRQELLGLQTDLRAELRRRGEAWDVGSR